MGCNCDKDHTPVAVVMTFDCLWCDWVSNPVVGPSFYALFLVLTIIFITYVLGQFYK